MLSSGIAGTTAANGSGVQAATMRTILLAWVLTMPVCVLLGAALFAAGLLVLLSHLAAAAVGLLVIGTHGGVAWKVIKHRKRPSHPKTDETFRTGLSSSVVP